MKVLKGFGVSILSFLLFLSLSVFGIAFTLNSTLLNPDFIAAEVNKIDISGLVIEFAEENLGQLTLEAQSLQVDVKGAIYKTISAQEPWLKEQINTAIYSAYDYFLGKEDKLNIIISLTPLKESLGGNLEQAIIQSLPQEIEPAALDVYFGPYYQEFMAQLPDEFTFDQSMIPQEAMEKMALARQYIFYFQVGYYALIGFMALLVLGVIFINRNVRHTCLGLGINFLIYGAIEFAGVYMTRNYVFPYLRVTDIPSSLQAALTGLYSDLLGPLQMFSIGLMAAGAVLIAVSFIYRPQTAQD